MNYCDGVGQKGLVDCDPENGQCEICYMADLEEENKKLKAENEALRNALRPLLAHWDDLRPGESINVDAARAALAQREQS